MTSWEEHAIFGQYSKLFQILNSLNSLQKTMGTVQYTKHCLKRGGKLWESGSGGHNEKRIQAAPRASKPLQVALVD